MLTPALHLVLKEGNPYHDSDGKFTSRENESDSEKVDEDLALKKLAIRLVRSRAALDEVESMAVDYDDEEEGIIEKVTKNLGNKIPIPIYRGLGSSQPIPSLESLKPGDKYTTRRSAEGTPLSFFTSDEKVALKFSTGVAGATNSLKTRYIFSVTNAHGAKAGIIAGGSGEKPYLSGGEYSVTSSELKEGVRYIELKEEVPAVKLLANTHLKAFRNKAVEKKETVASMLVTKQESNKLQIAYGEVYAPNRPDAQDEWMTKEWIQKAAHDFLRSGKMQQIDVLHNNILAKECSVVESFVAREGDPDFIPGSWVVGVHIPDPQLWGRVEKGEINGFSMEAFVTKHPQQVHIEIPPVVKGKTCKSEDHEHDFFVSYDENGKFKGGITSVTNGHMHTIHAGTHTEEVNGHSHRFSAVDNVLILAEI
jgi:hypothetical protein